MGFNHCHFYLRKRSQTNESSKWPCEKQQYPERHGPAVDDDDVEEENATDEKYFELC